MPERPIFVVGSPRSGTSLVFRLLRMAPGTTSIGTEGHALWETFHHPRRRHWESNAVGPEDIGSVERRYIAWAVRLLAGPGRFVDKTPRNVLRIPYLEALFPDASFVFVYRDGRAVVRSLYRNWERRKRVGRTPPFLLPPGFAVRDMPPRWWHFVLVPGWRDLNGRPLEEVCAAQYSRSVEAMLEAREPLGPERLVEVRYEDLVRDPASAVQAMFRPLALHFDEEVAERVRRTVRPPRDRPSDVLGDERILPLVRDVLALTGYDA
jgi:hypothetical protein